MSSARYKAPLALYLLQLCCLATFALSCFVIVTSFPLAFNTLRTVCLEGCSLGQITPGGAQVVASLGFSLDAYARGYLIFNTATGLVWWLIAAILVLRKSQEPLALLLTMTLLLQGTNSFTELLYKKEWYLLIVNSVGWLALMLVLYLFPDGHFVPHGVRWLVLLLGLVFALEAIQQLIPQWQFVPSTFTVVPWLVFLLSVIAVQVYRYRWVSGPVERQQTKWVVYGVAVYGLGTVTLLLSDWIVPGIGLPSSLFTLLVAFVVPLLALLIPLSLGIAILRSRLWDIDIIINRTLVYGLLTFALAIIYIGTVFFLQALLRPLFGRGNDVSVAAATLVVAALFLPLRRGVQDFIDRRFFRRKYDAAVTLATFSAVVRDEVDLQRLAGQLLEVVQETLQPEHVSLWIPSQTNVSRGSDSS